MKRFSGRILSMLLAAAMVFGLSGMTALAEEADGQEPAAIADTEEYNVKYAVSVWGINQDKDEKGHTVGLTFGPATGDNYTGIYGDPQHDDPPNELGYCAHLKEDEYDPENDQFCLHWMTWEEIARQSRIDPSVFQACLENGCTHSVNIVLNDELLETSYAGQMDDVDGAGVLRDSVQAERLYWNVSGSSYWGYPGSQVRAVLVGKDDLSLSENTYMLDDDNCLFSCFPEELKNEIVAKEVDSYSSSSMGSSDSQILYDKLWLFSGIEMYAESNTAYDAVIHPLEGELYQRSVLLGITTGFDDHAALRNWAEDGGRSGWWTRTMRQSNDTQVYMLDGNATPTSHDTNMSYGLAPGFCLPGPADLTELNAAIAAAEALAEEQEEYTEASWAVLEEALNDAYAIRDTEGARQSEVDDAALALQDAIDNLVPLADKTALEEVIREARTLSEENYTADSWAVFKEALTNAEAVDADPNVSQEETDLAQAELEDAISRLVGAADKTELENAIAAAEALRGDQDSYTKDSWNAVETALATAEEVDEDRNVTQAEVNEATDALVSAVATLEKTDAQSGGTVDKSQLLNVYEQARALSESDYTTNSWTALQTAVLDAQAVLLNVNASSEEVEEALDALQSALGGMVELADKSALQEEYDEDILLNEADYTPTSWDPFAEALATAGEVLAQEDASQGAVDAALLVLQDAKAGLVKAADKRALEAAIDAAEALDEDRDHFTQTSWDAVQTALAAAKAVDGNGDATQDEVEKALMDLVTAAAELEFTDPTGEEADKTDLLDTYLEAMGLSESDYSADTWAVFTAALSRAQEVLLDPYAASDEVEAALNELENAMSSLEPPAVAAFAIYSGEDDSLTFYANPDGTFPTEGSTYHDKAATIVYTEVDRLSASGTGGIPWYDLRLDVTDVVIDASFAEAQPNSLAYWFDGYEYAAFDGLEYMDTSEVTSLQYTFSGCSTLETLDVADWDTSHVTTMYGAFSGCQNLMSLDLSGWDVSNVWTLGRLFYGCKNLTSAGDLSDWDTGSVATMVNLFADCSALTDLDLSRWDTSEVTSMSGVFDDCEALTSVGDLSGWDTSANTTLYGMFYNCSSLTSVGSLSGWDTSKVTTMENMFRNCSSLTGVGDLTGWDTAKVTNMSYAFYNCASLASVEAADWNTANVTDMSFQFRGCANITSLDLSGWDTTKVTNYTNFAMGCSELEWVAIGEKTTIFTLGRCITQQYWYDSPDNDTLVSSNYLRDVTMPGQYWCKTVEEMPRAFAVYSETDDSLTFYKDYVPTQGEPYQDKEATIVYSDVDSVTATSVDEIPWYDIRESVTNVVIDASFAEARPMSLAYWFHEFTNAAFSGFENMDTSEVTSMYGMFSFCSALTELDLSGWDTANVTTMYSMFYDCPMLTGVGDLSGWDTSANTTMYGMFYNDSSLTGVGDLSAWDTQNVTDMRYTFRDCSGLTDLGDLSGWNTAKVTTLQQTFYNCSSLTGLDVSNWNTASVTDMSYTFGNCASLTSLDLSGWDTGRVTTNTRFATGCDALEWVEIGEKTTIFTLGQCISQKDWYDSPEGGSLVSSDYLQDVEEPGRYWTSTTGIPEAFAVYSAADASLSFYYDIAPAEGDTYNDKAVTAIYKKVDSLAATGTSGIPWYDIRESVTKVVIDASFAEAKPVSMAYWFDGYANASFSGFENIDTSEVTSLRAAFSFCSALTDLDLSGWDTAKVTTMYSLFYDCPALTSVGDLSGWDTSANTTIYGMFYNDSSLTGVGDLSDWDTQNVTDMRYTFRDCSKLTDLGDLSGWNTGKVTTLQQTFYNCNNLTGMDVSGWNTENVTDMSYTFGNCASLTSLNLSGWDTGSVTTNTGFATGCSALEWVAIGENTGIFRLGQCITQRKWYDGPENGAIVSSSYLQDVTEAGTYWAVTTNAPEAFAVYSAADDSLTFYEDAVPTEGEPYKGKAATTVYTDVESIAASSADGIPWYDKADSVTSVVIDDSFAAARPVSLAYWFNGFTNATFSGLEHMDTSDVTTMRSTFANCSSAVNLELADWNTAKVTTIREMFNACTALTGLDLTNWDTAKVTSMSSLFYNCPSLTGMGDLSGWDTSANTNMSGVFYNCSSLTSLDLSGWDTAKVTTMTYLFQACSNLTDVGGLSNWNTANVTNMTGTFRNCASMTSIDISGWDTTSVTTNTNFATGCSALEWVAIGENTTIFTLGQCVTQQDWYDRSYNGTLVSSNYLIDVTEAGQYWTNTEVVTADKSELQAEYDADMLLNEDDYTAASWGPFEEALAAAKEVLDDPNASEEAIGTALIELENARRGLVEACDKSALEEEYNADILLLEEDYTPATWAPFAEALAAAKDVIDNANATQTQVNEALSALQTAKGNLVEAADKSALNAAIAEAETLHKDSYTEESWAVFEEALEAAETVSGDANATQNEVDMALDALESARNGLVEVTDKTNLKAVIETVEAEALDGSDYTPESWALFEDALKASQDVINNPDAAQADIDDATVSLVTAVANLTPADSTVEDADKSGLLDDYVAGMALSKDDYTEDSWKALQSALLSAQDVLLDVNASQEAVTSALETLSDAIDSLKEKPSVRGVKISASQSAKTYDGTGITLTVTAEVSPDTATVSYQWYKDGSAISGATGSVYTTGADVSDSGTYKCVVTATSGTQSASAEATITITINAAKTGTTVEKVNGTWTYTVNGVPNYNYTGFGENSNGKWYVVNGKVLFNTSDILKDTTGAIGAKGDWYYVVDSKVQTGYTDRVSEFKNANGWWYIKNGKVDFSANTVAKNNNGWWYVTGGKVQFGYTGVANYKNANGWWYIQAGKVNFNFTGIASNKNGTWYLRGGKVQLGYNGTVTSGGRTYTVRNGKVS